MKNFKQTIGLLTMLVTAGAYAETFNTVLKSSKCDTVDVSENIDDATNPGAVWEKGGTCYRAFQDSSQNKSSLGDVRNATINKRRRVTCPSDYEYIAPLESGHTGYCIKSDEDKDDLEKMATEDGNLGFSKSAQETIASDWTW